jgi:hypothetical protein
MKTLRRRLFCFCLALAALGELRHWTPDQWRMGFMFFTGIAVALIVSFMPISKLLRRGA